ncbi:DUF1488 domain-containing protein [Rhizobium sp. KVB221]|uniref:DUF1488 domain-containing protein n=1 Tax=Rhizobium setariae TaxID=2801340 RepID=A0A937CQ19_9HYPH|nr:DUF1488 domain-containing protein [Rhizobium setariae]
MPLSFPNHMRSFDQTGNRVRFAGYDGVFEVQFYIEADVLRKLSTRSAFAESDLLITFDDCRDEILSVARKAYNRGHSHTICTLTVADFH